MDDVFRRGRDTGSRGVVTPRILKGRKGAGAVIGGRLGQHGILCGHTGFDRLKVAHYLLDGLQVCLGGLPNQPGIHQAFAGRRRVFVSLACLQGAGKLLQ